MKNKKLKALIQKPLRFHHQDIHEEIDELKRHQVKSRWYYIFWGAMAVAVVGGQIYVGTGYRVMAESVNLLTHTLVGELVGGPNNGTISH
jgi:hypothetical protein